MRKKNAMLGAGRFISGHVFPLNGASRRAFCMNLGHPDDVKTSGKNTLAYLSLRSQFFKIEYYLGTNRGRGTECLLITPNESHYKPKLLWGGGGE